MTQKLTTSEFIKKAKLVHGEKYNYDRVVYVNYDTKVEIYCNACDCYFWQISSNHLHGYGCYQCGLKSRTPKRKLTLEEFVKRARNKHQEKYNYDKSIYLGIYDELEIYCHTCNIYFWQTPNDHLNNYGCKACSRKILANKFKLSDKEFIEKSNAIHHNNYDYSLINYINAKTKIEIICNIHGSFNQTPGSHLNGAGCPKCFGSVKKTTEEFITQANIIHKNKYAYQKCEYLNAYTKVIITCLNHGDFIQTPSHHLTGRGCPKCKYELLSKKYSKLESKFILEAKQIHNDKYDYSLVNYSNAKNKIIIICQEHGNFSQVSEKHLAGAGCPKCLNKNETLTEQYLLELLSSIKLERQKFWKTIFHHNSNRKVDFYFEKDDQKYIVEYNGEQHYQPIRFGKMTDDQIIKQLNKQQLRDQELRDLCIQHSIKLIEIDGRIYKGTKIKDYLLQVLNLI